jgi:hypothetical protein
VRSRAGTSTLRSRLTTPSTGGGGGGGGGGDGGQQQPADPRTRFLTMFNNSGRPYSVNGIPYEDLYNFCADGRYFNRYTSGQTGTVGGYNVVEGRVILNQTSPEPQQSQIIVDLSEQVPNTAYINQNEFTRVAPQAC